MRKERKTGWVQFLGAAISFLISAFSVILAMVPEVSFLPGILFWTGMTAGTLLYLGACRKKKKIGREAENRGEEEENAEEEKIGEGKAKMPALMCFFSNRPAAAADILMLLCLVLTGYFAFVPGCDQTAAAVILFLLVSGIYAHILLNGSIFLYLYKGEER